MATPFYNAPLFQPSTWAEVDDAASSRKASSASTDPIITDILSFTNAPARCIQSAIPDSSAHLPPLQTPPLPTTDPADNSAHRLPRLPVHKRIKRGNLHIDDLLGIGRVDLESETFVRRYTFENPAPSAVPALTPYDPTAETSDTAAPLNPCSTFFNPALYLARFHATTSLQDLRAGAASLDLVAVSLAHTADGVRASSHAKLALAAAVIEQTRRSAHASASFSNVSVLVSGGDGDEFASAAAALDAKYKHILDRQQRVATLKRALDVARRFDWLFALPIALARNGTAAIGVVEDTAAQLGRVNRWAGAQHTLRAPGKVWILEEVGAGLDAFAAALETRLSRSAGESKGVLVRIVNVLRSVKRTGAVDRALEARLVYAKELLMSSGRAGAVSSVVRARLGYDDQPSVGRGDVVELMERMANSFVDGLAAFWELASFVCNLRPDWFASVNRMVLTLVRDYADAVRSSLLSESQTVTRKAALHIGRARQRALFQVNIPVVYLQSLDTVALQVVEMHFQALLRAVKTSSCAIARMCFNSKTLDTQLPALSLSLVEETIAEARDLLSLGAPDSPANADQHAAPVTSNSVGSAPEAIKPGHISGDLPDANLEALAVVCARVPEFIAYTLRELITERLVGPPVLTDSITSPSSLRSTLEYSQPGTNDRKVENESGLPVSDGGWDAFASSVIATARCCDAFVDGQGIDDICKAVKGLVWSEELDLRRETVEKRVSSVLVEAVRVYTKRLSPEVRWSARRVVDLQRTDDFLPSQSVSINCASAQAIEVLLNVCLAASRAQFLGARGKESKLIGRQLAEQVSDVLVSSLERSNGTIDMAVQVWVDISFLMAVLGDVVSSTGSAAKAREPFIRARSLASAAVRDCGFSFGQAEEETLASMAVKPSVARARMMMRAMHIGNFDRDAPSSALVSAGMEATVRLALESHQ